MTAAKLPCESAYRFDDVLVDCENFRIHKDGVMCLLGPRAFDLLVYLITQRGRVVDKQELFEQVWKETSVTDNALTKAVKEIRRAIGDDAEAPRYIETVPKRGYRFIAELQTWAADAASTDPAEENLAAAIAPVVTTPPDVPRASVSGPVPVAPPGPVKTGINVSRAKLWEVILMLLVILGALAFWLIRASRPASETTSVLKRTQVTVYAGLDINPSLSPDGNAIAYSSDHNGNFEIYVKHFTPGARELQLTADGAQNFQPAWSPDGARIAYYSKNRGGIWVMPASGGSAKQLTEFGSQPAWSPDGSLIAFQSNALTDLGANARNALPPSTLWVVAAEGGEARPLTQVGKPAGGHGVPSWSPDAKRLAFEVDDFSSASLWSVSASGDDLQPIIPNAANSAYSPIYAPDGGSIYYGTDGGLWKIRVSPVSGAPAGEAVQVVGAAPTRVRHPTISADGKKIAYSALLENSNLWSLPLASGLSVAAAVPLALTHDNSSRNNLGAFSLDGRKIAYTSWRAGTDGDIWVIDADGHNSVQLTTDLASDKVPSWFPRMDQIAFVSDRNGRGQLWAIDLTSRREKLLLDFADDVQFAHLSPDGKQVVFNSKKGGPINIWTIPLAGGEAKQLTFDKELIGFPSWSPDGQFIAAEMKRGDDTHIVIMPTGGGPVTQLTFDHGQSWPHSWSPDGDRIAFAGFRNGNWNIWWVSRSSKQQKQVTSYNKLNAFVRYPAWSPAGDKIVYEYVETTGNIWLMELK